MGTMISPTKNNYLASLKIAYTVNLSQVSVLLDLVVS